MEVRARAVGEPGRCAVCHDLAAVAVPCPACRTVAHPDCRSDLGRCPTLGCAGAREVPSPPRVGPSRRGVVALVVAAAVLVGVPLAALVLALASSERWWTALSTGRLQALDFDRAWCEEVVARARPIQAALETYRRERGVYPRSLHDLVPDLLSALPPPERWGARSEARWSYVRDPWRGYALMTTTKHWVSSYDALLFWPAPYPDARWRDRGFVVFEVDGWRYVVGGSGLFKGPDRLPFPERQ
ncbi:MAG: hypothetical protein M9894_39440 [Planctomycetes bacterium]|nr:hypothetical protein [Planctomycetota bacterium]